MDNIRENAVKSDPRLRKFDEKTTFWELLRYKYFTFYFFKKPAGPSLGLCSL